MTQMCANLANDDANKNKSKLSSRGGSASGGKNQNATPYQSIARYGVAPNPNVVRGKI